MAETVRLGSSTYRSNLEMRGRTFSDHTMEYNVDYQQQYAAEVQEAIEKSKNR